MTEISEFFDLFNFFIIIFRIYFYFSISILPFVLYKTFFESRYKPNSDYYYKKEWYHFLKVFWAKSAVKQFQNSFSNAIINETDESLEKPRKLTTFMRSDTQVFYGVDEKGNSLYIRITLRENRLAESGLQIRLSDGNTFQLPEHPLILISSIPERKWQAGGLKFEIIEPFSIIRITYNGFLRNTIRNNENDDIGDVQHCKFNFTWSASTEAKFFPQDVSTHELAEAVAVEPWKDAKWIKLLGFHTGFDQYGTLSGDFTFYSSISSIDTLSFTGTSFTPSNETQTDCNNNGYCTKTLELSSCRKRAWGPKEAGALHRMLTLYGANNKMAFTVGVRSYAKGCKELHVGSTMLPNKEIIFIEDCDISLPNFFEDGIIPGAFTFSFRAGNKLYKCTAFTHKTSIADMKNEEISGYNGNLVKTKYIINGEEAFGYGVFWYRYKGKGIKLPPYIIRPGIQTIEPEKKYVASLTSPECRSVCLAGAKGTSLALLTAIQTRKFNTLDGFCILAPALNKYLENNPIILEELTKLNDVACGILDGNLQEICDRLRHLFVTTALPQIIQDLILRELSLLKYSLSTVSTAIQMTWCWSVRGATVYQEAVDAKKSVYLRNTTYLDCLSDDDIMLAVTKCWAGVYDYEKVQYRRNRGFPIICDMAVVIQHTLDAETAGTATTIDQQSGSPAQMMISANYGLGLSLITKSIQPDTAVISRSWNDSLSILSTKIGSKSHKIIITDNGISRIESNNNKNLFCLTKEQLLEIGRAAIIIEKALGKAVKLKWAFYKDQLYILNVRGLHTSYKMSLSYQNMIKPQCVNPNSIIFNSTDNIFSSNDCVCALSKSTAVKFLDLALQKHYDSKETKKCGLKKLAVVHEIVGTDVFQTTLRYVDKDITEELKIHEMLTTGHSFVTEELNQEAIFRNQVTKWTGNIVNWCQMFSYCWNAGEHSEEAEVLSKAIRITTHPDASALEHLKIIKRNLHLFKHIINLHTSVNQSYIFYQKLFFNLIHEEQSDITQEEFKSFLNKYSTSSEYFICSKVELLAAVVLNRNLGNEFKNLNPNEAISWFKNNAPDCLELIEIILDKFGFRGVNEFDFYSETWENNIFTLVRIIKMIIQKMEKEKKPEIDFCDEIIYKSNKIGSKLNGKFAQWLNTRIHKIFINRSITLEAVARTINKFRWSYLDLGKKLVHEGKLPNLKLVYHLTQKEIETLVMQKRPELVERAMERAILKNNMERNLVDLNETDVLLKAQKEITFDKQGQQRVIGQTIVNGHVVGRICVLENIRQIEFLQPGDILVTKSLDLGWSPFFGVISGLICESGSVISQGAIAVMKKNLPCLIAVNATKIFKTGDQVAMMGNTGTVEKL